MRLLAVVLLSLFGLTCQAAPQPTPRAGPRQRSSQAYRSTAPLPRAPLQPLASSTAALLRRSPT